MRSSGLQGSPAGGLLRAYRTIGDVVEQGTVLGQVADPFGTTEKEVVAHQAGLIIGRTNLPVVNEGDGLFHIAQIESKVSHGWELDDSHPLLEQGALLDEDEII